MNRISISRIDESFVPRARSDLGTIHRDTDLLLFDSDDVAVLNGTAALIWRTCEGVEDIGSIADRLAEDYAASRDQIFADVVRTVRNFASRGLLEVPHGQDDGPSPQPPEQPPWHVKVHPP